MTGKPDPARSIYLGHLQAVLATEEGVQVFIEILRAAGALNRVGDDPQSLALHNFGTDLLADIRQADPGKALLVTANLCGLGMFVRGTI